VQSGQEKATDESDEQMNVECLRTGSPAVTDEHHIGEYSPMFILQAKKLIPAINPS
jgi:hypothetical protein